MKRALSAAGLPVALALFQASILILLAGGVARAQTYQIWGFVDAAVAGDDLPLPNANVYLTDQTGSTVAGSMTTTGPNGYFVVPDQPPGNYQLCAGLSGFVTSCEAVAITDADLDLDDLGNDVVLTPMPGVVFGSVLLNSGDPCYQADPNFDNNVTTSVVLAAAAGGGQTIGPVTANSDGNYVLPNVTVAGSYTVSAQCAASTASQNLTLTAANVSGNTSVNLTLPDSTPQIVSVIPTIGGQLVRTAAPGATVTVTVNTSNPGGHPLQYEWNDGTAGIVSTSTPTFNWTLGSAPAANALWVEVSDGYGGFATDSVGVSTGQEQPFFSGTVTDSTTGAAISGASILINGQPDVSDDNGNFALIVPNAQRYVIDAAQPGYALLSQAVYLPTSGLALQMQAANRTTCDPGTLCVATAQVQPAGASGQQPLLMQVTIPANSLVDATGQPPAPGAQVFVDVYGYDVTQPIPGDYGAIDANGNAGTLESYAALNVTASDSGGNNLVLAKGAQATVSMQVPTSTSAPTTAPLWQYNPASGYWMQGPTAALNSSNAYVAEAPSLGAFSAAISNPGNTACIALDVDHLPSFPRVVQALVPGTNGAAATNQTFTVDETPFMIYRLPPNSQVQFQVFFNADALDQPLDSFAANSGPSIPAQYDLAPDNGIPPDGEAAFTCGGFISSSGSATISSHRSAIVNDEISLVHGSPFLFFPAGQPSTKTPDEKQAAEQATNLYWMKLGNNTLDNNGKALPPGTPGSRGTLTDWKKTNGFPAAKEVTAIYYNNNDLQFGRAMHCLQDSPTNTKKVACYVTNYSADQNNPGGEAQKSIERAAGNISPIATVAMEWTGDPLAKANAVRFYAYDDKNGGILFRAPALDSEGDKYLPQMCLTCHGGSYQANKGKEPTTTGASFLPFDLGTFVFDKTEAKQGNILNGPSFTLQPPFSRPAQEEKFRNLNRIVLSTNPNQPIQDLIDGWYKKNAANPTNNAKCTVQMANCKFGDAVPTGWTSNPDLYLKVVAPYCRTCHYAAPLLEDRDFTTFDEFKTKDIRSRACNGGQSDMPQAEVTFYKLWLDGGKAGRNTRLDVLNGFLNPNNVKGLNCVPPPIEF